MTTDTCRRGTERKKAQGHQRGKDCTQNNPQRCRNCRYLAIVFRSMCSLGDFATTKNATCSKWLPKR